LLYALWCESSTTTHLEYTQPKILIKVKELLQLMPKINKLPRNACIYLNDSFRVTFIKKAIEKAGSMRQLGRIMGYTGNAPNWSIKQIAEGKQGIPLSKLERLCNFMGISLIDVEKEISDIKVSRRKSF